MNLVPVTKKAVTAVVKNPVLRSTVARAALPALSVGVRTVASAVIARPDILPAAARACPLASAPPTSSLVKVPVHPVDLDQLKQQKLAEAIHRASLKIEPVGVFVADAEGNVVADTVNVRAYCINGDQPLHAAGRADSFPLSRYLLEKGADPNRPDLDKLTTPLHLAAKAGNTNTIGVLLKHGAAIDIRNKYLEQPMELVKKNTSAYDVFFKSRLLFQISNIKTGGLLPWDCPDIKKEIIRALGDRLPAADLACFETSLQLDQVMMDASRSKEEKYARLLDAFHTLKPGEFLFLSNGFKGHATEVIIQRNDRENIEVVVANRGNGAPEYHERDGSGRAYVRLIAFDPEPGSLAQQAPGR